MSRKVVQVRTGAIVILCCLMLVGMTACGNGLSGVLNSQTAPVGEYPVTIGEVEIKGQPQKTLVLSPNIADVIIELGKEPMLLASADTCTQPELEKLNKISADDLEAIKGVGADLILTDPLSDEKRAALQETRVTVVEIAPATTREDYERLFGQVSSVFSGGNEGYELGQAAARKIFTRLDDIARITKPDVIVTACYLYDIYEPKGDGADQFGKAVTGDQFASVLMSYAGLTNTFTAEKDGAYKMETLKLSQPDIIFCAPGVKDEVLASKTLSGLKAVKGKRVYELETEKVERQGRTVISTATEMAGLAFPKLVEEESQVPTDPISQIESKVNEEISKLESSAQNETLYEEGDSGEEILDAQEKLTELGYLTTDYDGHFGTYTKEAIKAFQKRNGLNDTGKLDKATYDLLLSDDAKKSE